MRRWIPDGTALLIMDVQPQIVERFGDSGLTERLARAACAARGVGVACRLRHGRLPRGVSGDQAASVEAPVAQLNGHRGERRRLVIAFTRESARPIPAPPTIPSVAKRSPSAGDRHDRGVAKAIVARPARRSVKAIVCGKRTPCSIAVPIPDEEAALPARHGDKDPRAACVALSSAPRGTDSRDFGFPFQEEALLSTDSEKLPVV